MDGVAAGRHQIVLLPLASATLYNFHSPLDSKLLLPTNSGAYSCHGIARTLIQWRGNAIIDEGSDQMKAKLDRREVYKRP